MRLPHLGRNHASDLAVDGVPIPVDGEQLLERFRLDGEREVGLEPERSWSSPRTGIRQTYTEASSEIRRRLVARALLVSRSSVSCRTAESRPTKPAERSPTSLIRRQRARTASTSGRVQSGPASVQAMSASSLRTSCGSGANTRREGNLGERVVDDGEAWSDLPLIFVVVAEHVLEASTTLPRSPSVHARFREDSQNNATLCANPASH